MKKSTAIKTIAVENFLGTLHDMTTEDALMNLAMDARSYGWNAATVRAIRLGIYTHAAKRGPK